VIIEFRSMDRTFMRKECNLVKITRLLNYTIIQNTDKINKIKRKQEVVVEGSLTKEKKLKGE